MSEICALVSIQPKPGTDPSGELEEIFGKLVAGVEEKDRGVPGYAYFRGDDGHYRVIERYESSEAYLEHMRKIDTSLVRRLSELADFTAVEILGDPDEEVRAAIEVFGPQYRALVVGVWDQSEPGSGL